MTERLYQTELNYFTILYAVLITVALCFSLKSRSTKPLALFFVARLLGLVALVL